ncbi:MAG: hypothetical protein AABY22_07790 [Nanoarchaeota archaeon]
MNPMDCLFVVVKNDGGNRPLYFKCVPQLAMTEKEVLYKINSIFVEQYTSIEEFKFIEEIPYGVIPFNWEMQ